MTTDDGRVMAEPVSRRELEIGERSFTRERTERIVTVGAAVGSAVIAVQTLLQGLGDAAGLPAPIDAIMLWSVIGAVGLLCVLYLIPRAARLAAGIFSISFAVTVFVWPLLGGELTAPTDEPWPWLLLNVGSAAAAIAFPVPVAIAYTVLLPLAYGTARIGLGAELPEQLWPIGSAVSYPLFLGLVIVVVVRTVRGIGERADADREAAVASVARAAQAEAEQEERVAFSALLHDSVLAALIAAERAESPRARSLATSMARDALAGFAPEATPGTDASRRASPAEPVGPAEIARGVRRSLADAGVAAPIDVEAGASGSLIPPEAGAALMGAATQAIRNAVEHAGGQGLRVIVTGEGPRSVRVRVGDTGPGFDPRAVPADRLGIAASIRARVAAVGGSAIVHSSDEGTVWELRWNGGGA